MRIESFEPVVSTHAKILILGTMPSVLSLEKQEYYGNPQNAFWRILFGLWGRPAPAASSETKSTRS